MYEKQTKTINFFLADYANNEPDNAMKEQRQETKLRTEEAEVETNLPPLFFHNFL